MEKEFNLKEKRKEAFSWAECMDDSGNCITEILEDLQDRIEKQDKELISILKKYNKNKLMGKDFILISIKDFNKLAGDL